MLTHKNQQGSICSSPLSAITIKGLVILKMGEISLKIGNPEEIGSTISAFWYILAFVCYPASASK